MKVKAVLFDQILVSLNLQDRIVEAGVFNGTEAISGQASRVGFGDGGLIVRKVGDFASDHVPVWVESAAE